MDAKHPYTPAGWMIKVREFLTLRKGLSLMALASILVVGCKGVDYGGRPPADPYCVRSHGVKHAANASATAGGYLSADGITHLNYNFERAKNNPETAPLIIFLHGGNFTYGNEDHSEDIIYTRHDGAQAILDNYNIASLNFRHWNGLTGIGQTKWAHPATKNDVLAFIDQVDELEGVSNDKVCVVGSSTGGSTAIAVAVNPTIDYEDGSPMNGLTLDGTNGKPDIDCVLSYGGVYAMLMDEGYPLASINQLPQADRDALPTIVDQHGKLIKVHEVNAVLALRYGLITEYKVPTMLLNEVNDWTGYWNHQFLLAEEVANLYGVPIDAPVEPTLNNIVLGGEWTIDHDQNILTPPLLEINWMYGNQYNQELQMIERHWDHVAPIFGSSRSYPCSLSYWDGGYRQRVDPEDPNSAIAYILDANGNRVPGPFGGYAERVMNFIQLHIPYQ